ncbi:hypothetical protein ACSBR1_002360 [Camellia fascicularis]
MNDAVGVTCSRASLPDMMFFAFGLIATSTDKVTLVGYCPVFDELEPCHWKILPASGYLTPHFSSSYF